MMVNDPVSTSDNAQLGPPMASPAPGRLTRRRKALFVAVILLALLGLIEGAARLVFPPPPPSELLAQDETYGYLPRDFPPRNAAPKAPGELRVLLLGDSFAQGMGASAPDKSFAAVLEQRLREGGMPARVINAGVIGWGASQEREFLEREGAALAPDIVLTAVFLGNDVADETGATRIALFHGRPVLASRLDSAGERALSGLRLRSRAAYAILGMAGNAPLVFQRRDAEPPYADVQWRTLMNRPPWLEGEFYSITRGANPVYDAALDRLLENLEGIARIARALGAEPRYVLIPGRLQALPRLRNYALRLNGIDPAEADPGKLNRRMVPVLTERELAVLDLYPLMESRPPDAALLYNTSPDDHFTDAGHEFAGARIADWMLQATQ